MLRQLGVEPVVPSTPKEPGDGMNKTERSFSEMLMRAKNDKLIRNWGRESLTFRLAGRTRYTPDFIVWTREYRTEPTVAIEVKGWMRDDAAVKLKVAAEMYPEFQWLLVRRDGRHGWNVREVGRTGIGTHPIQISWINGGGV